MLPHGIEAAIISSGPWAVGLTLLAGLLVGLTPAAYLSGPAVLAYMTVGAKSSRGAITARALAYVLGAAVPMATLGLLLGIVGEVVMAVVAELVVA